MNSACAIVLTINEKQISSARVGMCLLDLALLEEPIAPIDGVSAVMKLYPSVLHVLHRTEVEVRGFRDLFSEGNVWAGTPGGIGHRLAQSLADEYASRPNAVRWLDDPWSADPDVYFIFGGILARDARSRLDGFRLWSLDDPAALMHGSVAEAVVLRHPNLRPFILPAALYPELSQQAALTLSVSTLLVARSSLEADRMYEVAAAVDRAAPLIAASYPLAGLPHLSMSNSTARTLSLHPGAQRYADRNLPSVLERYAEIFALIATMVVAAGSWGGSKTPQLAAIYLTCRAVSRTQSTGGVDAVGLDLTRRSLEPGS